MKTVVSANMLVVSSPSGSELSNFEANYHLREDLAEYFSYFTNYSTFSTFCSSRKFCFGFRFESSVAKAVTVVEFLKIEWRIEEGKEGFITRKCINLNPFHDEKHKFSLNF
jgi:hypothetical protein